ncbi:distal membrane-arm assembly complex protein 1 [Gouania willdenowi]|uniref:Distal membrane-arm assembly complex protein 1-like domain-containing protein n=1 Tax=Gouania willdenowi TaxID=441366 RepID=A0A8C5HTT0_GOUWI|nr:distal membrane-arm assembly complex protein 1 [Gouania willdenowi]
MSAAPESIVPDRKPLFGDCWGCRVLGGGGLVLSGAYVFNVARKAMKPGGPTSMGIVAQVTFAACVAAFGIVVLTDPVGKSTRKT